MKIIDRYLFRECATYFAITLFAFMSILLTLRMLRFAALIVNKGVAPHLILGVFVSIIPTFLEVAIPMATLLGVMMALARLSGDSEIIVLRASGVSIFQLIRPILLFGLITSAVNFYVSRDLKPWGFQNLSQVLFEIARSKSSSGLTQGVFNPLGQITLYAESIDYKSGAIEQVLIDDRRDPHNRKIIFSHQGQILSDPVARTITLHLINGVIHEIVDKKYGMTRFSDNNLVLDSDELLDPNSGKKSLAPREMTLPQLRAAQDEIGTILLHNDEWFSADGKVLSPTPTPPPHLDTTPANVAFYPPLTSKKDAVKKLQRVRIELGSRFSMPFATLVLALVALPLGILPPRTQKTWGAGASLLLGLMVFVVYYGILSVGSSVVENGSADPVVALWAPNVVTMLLALYFIIQIGAERWTSVVDALTTPFLSLRRRFATKKQTPLST